MTLFTVKSLKISSLSNEIIIKLLNNWGLEFCSDFSLIIDLFGLYVQCFPFADHVMVSQRTLFLSVDLHRSKPLILLVPFNLHLHCFQG